MIRSITQTIIFLSIIALPAFSQDFGWVKHLREPASSPYGSGKEQFAKKVIVTKDNGLLICGSLEGNMDFNPGVQDTILSGVSPMGDGFVIKLDSLGEFEWLSRVTGLYGSAIKDITEDDSGNLYYTGFVRGMGTLDRGGENVSVGSGANYTSYVVALNPTGSYLWHQIYNNVSGAHSSTGHELLVVANKLFLSTGFSGTFNANPSGSPIYISDVNGTNLLVCLDTNGTYNWHHQVFNNADDGRTLTADSSGYIYYSYIASNTYLKKFDSNGTILLDVDWGSGNSLIIEDVAIDQDGGIYVTGYGDGGSYWYPTYDLDPGPGIFEIPAGTFYARLDHNGNFYHGKGLAGSMYNSDLHSKGNGIALDYQKNIYLTGRNRIGGIIGNHQIFINKYDTLGNEIWAYTLDGQSDDYGSDIYVDENLSVFTVGGFSCTVDFDPSNITYHYLSNSIIQCSDGYSEDGFILKWEQDSCDHLGIIIDTIVGNTCFTPGLVEAHAVNSVAPYLYSWDGGPFSSTPSFAPAVGGSHTLTVRAANQCEKTRSFYVPGPTTLGVDVQINSWVNGIIAPDFSGKLKVDAFNAGCTAASGQVFLVMPDSLIYDSSSVSPDFILGDTLVWNYSSMDYQSPHFYAEVYYTGDTMIQIGDNICYPVWITPIADEDSTNNYKTICQTALTSYDPNEKYVYPEGECIPNYIDTAQRLTYTIQFQNTGTLEATNIYILDSISAHLDVTTLEVVATSHTMMTEILPDEVLKFRFDDIHLPDSSSNLEASTGYVVFEISQKDSVPNYSQVSNSARIYFDYNVPVFTSEVSNTIVDVIPSETSSYLVQTACDSLASFGTVFNASGQYPVVLSNSFGCDSTLLLDLTLEQSTSAYVSQTVCDEYVIGGTAYNSTGNYDHYLTNSVGCDSIIHLDLIVQNTTSNFNIDTCSGVDLNGVTYSVSGVYTQVLPNSTGCDSIITYNINIFDANSDMEISGCDSIMVNEVNYSSSGVYQQTLVSSLGCDSILTLDIDLNASTIVHLNELACNSYMLNGVNYTNSGNYYQYFTNTVGCDSILALDLTIDQDSESNLFIEGIDSVVVNGNSYYTSGTYTQYLTSAAGCDSTLNLYLSIGHTSLNELNQNLSIFPNPTSSMVYVTGEVDGVLFHVMDGLGRIQNVQIHEELDQIKIDLSNLSAGIYYIISDSYKAQPIVKQ